MTRTASLSLTPQEIEQALVEFIARKALNDFGKAKKPRSLRRPFGGSVCLFRDKGYPSGRWGFDLRGIRRSGVQWSRDRAEAELRSFAMRTKRETEAHRVAISTWSGVAAFVVLTLGPPRCIDGCGAVRNMKDGVGGLKGRCRSCAMALRWRRRNATPDQLRERHNARQREAYAEFGRSSRVRIIELATS